MLLLLWFELVRNGVTLTWKENRFFTIHTTLCTYPQEYPQGKQRRGQMETVLYTRVKPLKRKNISGVGDYGIQHGYPHISGYSQQWIPSTPACVGYPEIYTRSRVSFWEQLAICPFVELVYTLWTGNLHNSLQEPTTWSTQFLNLHE